jgi:L-ascorbate metabolism protein UlaG (beta-lactamase superfamily)
MRRLAAAVACALAVAGCAPAADRFARSPEWRDGAFHNPPSWPELPPHFADLLHWRFLPHAPAPPRPPFRPPFVDNDGAALRQNRSAPSVTWIGHATTLIQGGGVSILTDPIFSDTISGFVPRTAPPGVGLTKLPRIDAVLISHSHRDHLDEDSLRALGAAPLYLVPLGLGDQLRALGLLRVVELDWWQSAEVTAADGARATVTLVPAQHWSQHGLTDQNRALWGGYIVDAGGARFYFAGDTGYPAAFVEIGRRFPRIDFALLPIGAYEPRWFMHAQHISPEEAAVAFAQLGARTLVPIHWATFKLSDEPMDEPPALLYRAMGRRANRILFLPIGGSYFASSTR